MTDGVNKYFHELTVKIFPLVIIGIRQASDSSSRLFSYFIYLWLLQYSITDIILL